MLVIDVLDDNSAENWSAATMIEEMNRTVKALNKTAQQATVDIKADMSTRFTLRSQWPKKGIRFDRATVDDPVARIYSIDGYLWKQQYGETYKPDGHVAIPLAARPTPKSLIPRDMLPNALRTRKDVFRFDFSAKPNYRPFPMDGIFQRVMNGKHLRILYLLKDKKKTNPRWNFDVQVESAVDKYFDRYFDDIDDISSSDIATTLTREPRFW